LYYRLAVVPIELPPLRARGGDIAEFVLEFFHLSTQKHQRPTLVLPQSLLPYFTRYRWPGNVRQLQNAIERIVVLCRGDAITISDLPDFLRLQPSGEASPAEVRVAEGMTLDAVEKELIFQALRKYNWNQSQAASYLGITRKTLMGRIARHGIERDPSAGSATAGG
jgi:two-component system NtrC family response regulator